MRWVRFAIFVLIVTLLQASLLEMIAVTELRIKPDMLLILLVFFAVYYNTTDAIISSFAIGFGADLVAGVMGPFTVSFGLFGTLLSYLCRLVVVRHMPYR